jgi:excisionase family DNA binding protein
LLVAVKIMNVDRRSYTTLDIAKRMGVSPQTVKRWVDAGRLRAWKTMGGHRRIDAESAELLFQEYELSLGTPEKFQGGLVAQPAALSAVVVDDNPVLRWLLSDLLLLALPEAHVELAENGFQALEIVGRIRPDIVVTDIQMPHLNGIEMIRHLMANPASSPPLIVAVSKLSTQEIADLGGLPASALLFSKPVDCDRFIAAMRQSVLQAA